MYEVNDIWQIEMQTVEPLVPEPHSFGVEISTDKLKKYKSPGIDQITAEPSQAGGNKLLSGIHSKF
jgi:hypothetical protein